MFKPNRAMVAGTLLMVVLQLLLPVWAEVVVTPDDLEARVTQYLIESTPLDDSKATLHVELVRRPTVPIHLEGENLQILFDDSRTVPLTFRTVIQVTLSTSEDTKYIGVPVRLFVEKPVWVVKRLIRAKEPITLKDVVLQQKRMDYDAPYSLGAQDKVAAYTSRINIGPGSVLDIRKLSLTPAVYRNDDVHLILSMQSGVNVTVFGKALEDGAIGQRIRVRQRLANNKTKIYTAEVIDKNIVKVRI